MKTLILILSLSIFSCSCKSQNKPIEVSLEKKIPQDLVVDKIEHLNFDNDKEIETIITASDSTASYIYEFWFKKDKLFNKIVYPWVSINYKWFVNIDDDNLHEIIRAQGYEDGINYAIYDIVENNHEPLLFFTPLLMDEEYPNNYFWGYPWDITSIIINNQKEILISLDSSIEREDDFTLAPKQKKLPIIFFQGKSTQPEFKFDKHKINQRFLGVNMILSNTKD